MFEDRYHAGKLLSIKLLELRKDDVLVLSIPRGGVPVGRVVADALSAPLDVVVTRKLGAPYHPELAIGAVGPDGVCVLDKRLIVSLGLEKDYILQESQRKIDEVVERIKKFRGNKPSLKVRDKIVVLVDDGIATGATVEAAIRYLRKKEVGEIILAVPVIPKESVEKFQKLSDKLIVLEKPIVFHSVGQYYKRFPQLTDEEVIRLLE